MQIGIFDSGIGGESIAIEFRKAFPDAVISVINDKKHLPYGDKTEPEIIKYTTAAVKKLVDLKCDIIVIACNTASTIALPHLRATYPKSIFIGIEPMIKQAARFTKSKNIAVCATPRTLSSSRYGYLKNTYSNGIQVIEPDCSDWAYLIENSQINKIKIKDLVEDLTSKSTDVIVLGCTHYNWIKNQIVKAAGPNIKVIEPSKAIVKRAKDLLKFIDS